MGVNKEGSIAGELAAVLKEAIAIPSVNPAFGGEGEAALADYVAGRLADAGIEVERQEVFPGRSNLIARIGEQKGAPVLLEAHLDTVGVDGFEGDPFDPVERDGRLYGRGACDTKASLAVFLCVARHFARSRPRLPLVFAATIDEEEKQTGAFRLIEAIGPLAGAITGEPTRLDIVHAHKGVLRFGVTARGTAAHGAFPERGDNAIFRMGRVLASLEKEARRLDALEVDPHLGRPTLNVGTIRGGQAVNVVPDSCRVEIDRRLLASEDGEAIASGIRELLADQENVEVETPYLNRPGMATDPEGPFCTGLAEAVRAVKGGCELTAAPYMTNGAAYAAAGVPTLVFGPGDIAQAHTRSEFVETDQLEAAFRILKAFLGD